MSGSRKRHHSKWDDEDSVVLAENSYDRAQTRRPREPRSPSRGSRRHDSRSKESTMTWDREGNSSRISPGLDDWRPRHSSRSPRNGWSRSHRISRSRSRSQSPGHNIKRESTVNGKSRSRSGAPAQICRDFTVGRCRRGNSCHFLHQDEMYDVRRVECSSPDDWESRSRRTGGSRYSPGDSKDCASRTEKSAQVCKEFLKGSCRRGDLCRYVHNDSAADVFEKEPVDDRYRNRDHDLRGRGFYPDHDKSRESRDTYRDLDHRRRDTYPDGNHEYEPPKRNETPCKFFAAGNCRNGTRCKFSHQVQEIFSSDRRSRGDKSSPDQKFESGQAWDGPRWSDATTISTVPAVQGWGEDKNEKKEMNTVRSKGGKRGPDHEYEGDRVWDGPSWSDVITVSNVPVVHGWGEDKNDTTEVVKDVIVARPGDDAWSHDMLDIKQTRDTTVTACKPLNQDEMQPLQWKIENNIPVVHGWGDDKNEITELTNDVTRARPRGDCWSHDMLDIKQTQDTTVNICKPQIQDSMQPLQWKIENNVPAVHGWGDDKNDITEVAKNVTRPRTGDDCWSHDMLDISQARDTTVNACKPPVQDKMQPLLWKIENNVPGMGLSAPRNIDNKAADVSHAVNLPSSAIATDSAIAHSPVSREQLAQLSHLTASLTQLLESRQQFSHISSAVNPHGLPNLLDIIAPVPPVSASILQPNQAPEVLKPYDPVCDSIEPRMPNLGNHLLPIVEQKISNKELDHRANHEIHLEGGNVNQQGPLASSTEEKNGKITAEETAKAPENGPSLGVDDGAEDIKKLKDTKGLRPFKFALAEFVKELLKPSWKDGQVSKDAYKTIVKKVVEKVSETLGPQIPQTKEKIDLYLSCSKPKIDKLVQAYVGKHKS